MAHLLRSFAFLAMLCLMGLSALPLHAQNEDGPLRMGIAGLVHGHVGGMLQAMQTRDDVVLVGIAELDEALGPIRKMVAHYGHLGEHDQ